MKILVIDKLKKQYEGRRIPDNAARLIFNEFQELARLSETEDDNEVFRHLKINNGKKFKGQAKDEITFFKYRLSGGDRIVFTWAKYLSYISEEDKDALVLLAYSNHDDQVSVAERSDYLKRHEYEDVIKLANDYKALAGDISDGTMSIDDEEFEVMALLVLQENFKGYVVSDDLLAETGSDFIDRNLLLSQEQQGIIETYIKHKRPTLIFGGAGTGKTLISVHLLNSFAKANPDKRAAYFTQSWELLEKVRNQFMELYGGDNENIDFFDINEYCLENLRDRSIDRTNLIKPSKLQELLYSGIIRSFDKCKEQELNAVDLVTEIRGSIKGGLNKDWSRTVPQNQQDFTENVSVLIKKGYLKRLKSNPKYFIPDGELSDLKKQADTDESLKPESRDLLFRLLSYFSSIDTNLPLLYIDDYMERSEETTFLSKAQRELSYTVSQDYQNYLESNGLYDDNDLARLMLSTIDDNYSKYDFIITDEVQDYTELQLILISSICNNKNGLIFTGDVNQIINPTTFSASRLTSLFVKNNIKPDIQYLQKNFRCGEEIVNIANIISSKRREIIGSQSKQLEQPDTAISKYDGAKPIRLDYSDENITELLNSAINYPGISILVPDDQTKESLIKIIGHERHDKHHIIFTIPEIKGMEYTYVVCYNLIGLYHSIWQELLNDSLKHKKQTKYRYFFNMLYVAVTRSEKYLCMIDEYSVPQWDVAFNLQEEKAFDLYKLLLNNLSSSDESWYQEGLRYLDNGKYEDALNSFKMCLDYTESKDRTVIYKCHKGIAINNNDVEKALKYSFLIGDRDELERIYKMFNCELLDTDMCEYLKLYHFNNNYDVEGITYSIEQVFRGFSEEDVDRAKLLEIKHLNTLILEKTN